MRVPLVGCAKPLTYSSVKSFAGRRLIGSNPSLVVTWARQEPPADWKSQGIDLGICLDVPNLYRGVAQSTPIGVNQSRVLDWSARLASTHLRLGVFVPEADVHRDVCSPTPPRQPLQPLNRELCVPVPDELLAVGLCVLLDEAAQLLFFA